MKKTLKRILFRMVLVALVIAAGWGSYRFMQRFAERQREVATAEVERSDVIVRAYTRGELRAVRSSTLTAPNLRGTVQVTRLAELGAYAREGDLIVEFDDAEVRTRVEEQELELEQTDEDIRRSEAELAIRASGDQVELQRAEYTVRRAELEAQRNELLADIDAKKNTLNLDEAQRRLEKLKSDIESRRRQQEAELAVLRQQRARAVLEVQRDLARLNQVKVLSPMTGLVAIRQQRTSFFFAGSQLPDIREGDELRAGMPVADVLDLSELEVVARVGEVDRANLSVGQEAIIRLDALADKEVHGSIKSLSATATSDPYSNDPAKKFDVIFEVDMRELLEALNASPEQIEQTLAQAEANRQRGVGRSAGGSRAVDTIAAMMAERARGGSGGGDATAGGRDVSGRGSSGGAQAEGGRSARGAGGRTDGRGGGGTMTVDQLLERLPEAQRAQAKAELDKTLNGRQLAELSAEERRELTQKFIGSGRGGQAGAPSGGRGTGTSAAAGAAQAAAARMASATLPSPPGAGSQLDVLLRPGLLADVEIIVENIPDAINVPVQAVFESEGRPMVFVQTDEGTEKRFVTLSKRSESTMVISEGLREGEIVALADPNARPGEEAQALPQAVNPVNPMQGMPVRIPMGMPMGGGGRGGGGGGRRGR